MIVRSRAFLLGLMVILIAGLALWSTCHSPKYVEEPPASPSAQVPVAAGMNEIDRTPVEALRIGPILIVDSLTDDMLDLNVTLVSAEKRELSLKSGDVLDLSGELEEARLRYSLAHGKFAQDLSLKVVAHWSDGKWILRLPYTAGVLATLHPAGLSAESPPGKFMLLPDFGPFLEEWILEQTNDVSAFSNLFNIPVQDMTFEGKTRWFLNAKSLQPIGKVDSATWDTAPIYYPAAGPHIVGWASEFGDSVFIPVELIPGKIISVELYARPRPVLQGVLLDWHGDPVPDEPISFVTSLDLVDYDRMPQDPHSLVGYQREGQFYSTMKKTYMTDNEGNFAYRVPRGQDYAIWSHALGGYCFWSTREHAVPFSESDKIVLQLLEPSPENSTVFRILWPDGEPFTSGSVSVSPAGDVPFFRQWPYRVPLDERGEVMLVGFEPGTLVGVRVRLDGGGWLNSSYAAPYLTIPNDHRVEVRLTEDAIRKKSE